MNHQISLELGLTVAHELRGSFHSHYSGRYMYDRTCVGWSGDINPFYLALALRSFIPDIPLGVWADAYRTDSLGMGVIYYFPGITTKEE